MAPRVAAACSRAVSCWAGGRAFQAVQRNRIIWCKTLAPSRVSGTAGRESIVPLFWHRRGGLVAGVLNRTLQTQTGPRLDRLKPLGYLDIADLRGNAMLNHSTILSESPHFHPPVSVAPPIMFEGVVRKPTARAESAPQRRVPPKRLCCKTCQGKCCIGRCRF